MAELDLGPAQPETPAPQASGGSDLGPATPDDSDVDHSAFLDRVARGSRASELYENFKSGASEAWGDSPLGMDPNGEASSYFRSHGIFADPAKARYGDALRVGAEAIARPVATAVDGFLRTVSAGIGGAVTAVGQDIQHNVIDPVSGDNPIQITPALKSGVEWAMTDMASPLMRTTHTPDGRIVDQPVGGAPKPEDFSNVANLITPSGEPPVAPGNVRAYTGHSASIELKDFQGKTYFTTNKAYAEGYAAKSEDPAVSYVDLPENHPSITPEWEDQGIKQGFTFHPVLDADDARAFGFKTLPSRAEAVANTQGKLQSLYNEYGIHPSEVLYDAQMDPKLAAHLNSDDPMLPPQYTGVDPAAIKSEQIKADPPKGIAGNSPELNDALVDRTSWPQTPDDIKPPTRSTGWGGHVSDLIDRMGVGDITNDLQRAVSPMAMRDASATARSSAKDFANAMRTQRWDWQRLHTALTGEFEPGELKAMWNAADADLVAKQTGETTSEGLASLPARQRETVRALQDSAASAWSEAKQVGMVKGEGLGEGYVPRKVLFDYGTSEPGLFKNSMNAIGRNLKTSTSSLMKRKYMTAGETEAAAQGVNSSAKLVRDIRTLPLVTSKLREAVAGRKLINSIRDAGEATTPEGELSTVYEGSKPSDNYFTIDGHPAFTTWKPRLKDGRSFKDADGNTVMDKVPLYVRKDFEGPLRAVLSQNEGLAYRAVMDAKARSTSLIMYSPLLHNAVIAGRVLPAMGGNPIATARLYMKGAAVRANPEMMREAIANGLAPIGRGGGAADWAKTLTDPQMKPGRSLTSSVAGQTIGRLPQRDWSKPGLHWMKISDTIDKTKSEIDQMGHFWHNTLLWDRVADMQAGIYDHYIQDAGQAGVPRDAAAKTAAHLANRYAGSIPMEALSQNSRKIANVLLFSRSFTMGTVGSVKDMFTGMPRDVLAQIERDHGVQQMLQTKSYAQRKAIGIVAADVALLYAGGSITQSVLNVIRGDDTAGEEAQGYADRFSATMKNMQANPMEFFNPLAIPNGVVSNSENEPGRQHHILSGYQSDGTALYTKNPTGKTPEDMIGWMTAPAQTLYNKLSTFAKPTWDTLTNQDFAGRHIYDPNPQVPEDYMRNISKVVLHYMAAQVPEGAIEAASDLLFGTPTSDEQKVDALKVMGPLVGLQFSPGAPGGPAAGEYFRAQEQNKYATEQVLPQAKKDIKEGRLDEARDLMDKANINPKLQKFFVESTLNPERRFVSKAFKQYMNGLGEEQQERLSKQLERNQ